MADLDRVHPGSARDGIFADPDDLGDLPLGRLLYVLDDWLFLNLRHGMQLWICLPLYLLRWCQGSSRSREVDIG